MPSNSTEMRRPASLAGSTNSRRYQPMLVSGYSRPRGFAPWPTREGLLSMKGRSIAQSWGRSIFCHADASKRGEAGPFTCPALAKSSRTGQLAVAEVLDCIVGIAQSETPAEVQQQPLTKLVGFVGLRDTGGDVGKDWSRSRRARSVRSASSSLPVITPADAASPVFTKSRRVHLPMPGLPNIFQSRIGDA